MPDDKPDYDHSEAKQTCADMDSDARQALIVDQLPRIPPLKPDKIDKGALEALTALRSSISLPPLENMPEHLAITLRHPELFLRHMDMAIQLFNGSLKVRHRELAILRNAWLCQAPYEWGEHVSIGKQLAYLTSEEIERVIIGSSASGWSEDDQAIICSVEEMHQDAMISEETWTVLARYLNEQQLLELPILIGQYIGVAYLQNSLRSPLMPDNPGLSAR